MRATVCCVCVLCLCAGPVCWPCVERYVDIEHRTAKALKHQQYQQDQRAQWTYISLCVTERLASLELVGSWQLARFYS
ncbi:uncharacterized protein CYBJADRAFT_167807, partial [Cyberlindnera jadinii NRRL Y-1542]